MWIVFGTIFPLIAGVINCHHADTYTAAVVEYFPVDDLLLSASARLSANVNRYMDILNSVKEELDIIVFPESTLTYGANLFKRDILLELSAILPNHTNISPCEANQYASFIRKLSCGAKQSKAYVSVNLLEKEKCTTECKHEDKWNVYNTNVVFDRSGNIVARYRKYNLFHEKHLDTTDKAERVTFTTDFNVTFGLIICFDILFEDPAIELVKTGVKHFIFPNMWYSELNELTSLQAHSMWSYVNDVVLLSAGANNPTAASGGSAIYQGRLGALEYYISGNEGTKVLVHKVRKTWSHKENKDRFKKPNMTNFLFWSKNYENYKSELLDTEKTEQTICANKICCTYKINATSKISNTGNEYKYHIAMLPRMTWHYYQIGDTCIVMACLNNNISSCGNRYKNEGFFPITFHNITVTLKAPQNEKAYHYPTTLSGNFIPLEVDQFSWQEATLPGKRVEKSITLMDNVDNLFTFGIFGRIFEVK